MLNELKFYQSREFIEMYVAFLSHNLIGYTLLDCYSQDKDVCVFEFSNFSLVANFNSKVGLLVLSSHHKRAKKNSITLFDVVINHKITAIYYHIGERSFDIVFDNEYVLVFKLYGCNSNLILFDSNKILIDIFRHSFESDYNFSILNVARVIKLGSHFNIDLVENYSKFYKDFIYKVYYLDRKLIIQQKIEQLKINTLKSIDVIKSNILNFDTYYFYKLRGDLLMTYLHLDIKNESKITLFSYELGKDMEVKLDPNLSMLKNAEKYYAKSKNASIELDRLHQNLKNKEQRVHKFNQLLLKLSLASSQKELDNIEQILQKEKANLPNNQLPYKEYEFADFKIWIGKNAVCNDLLTLKYSFKEDLWFHAKDVSGSHVLLKYQSGKVFPKFVIERTAEIAAFNSKAKNDSLVPVIYTPKKYVRKPKGFATGLVKVDKESIILVKPKGY
jgi:predicted ribosome quality control (RQC) complex YloA/Tae2 family protein